MEDNFPISNIPLLFTQYRTRILEESGKIWFHSDNQPNGIAPPTPSPNGQDNLPEELSGVAGDGPPTISPTPELTDQPDLPVGIETQSSSIESSIHNAIDPASFYDHPDPWGKSLPEDRVTSQGASTTESQPPISINAEVSTPQAESISQSEHPSQKVNLFPIEDFESHEQDETGLYDLTEFHNGEIEVPPVAVRDSQLSRFEKVTHHSHSDSPLDDPLSSDEDPSEPLWDSELSSAEIAKHRLRNCL